MISIKIELLLSCHEAAGEQQPSFIAFGKTLIRVFAAKFCSQDAKGIPDFRNAFWSFYLKNC
jgi:hypothetical protein